MKHKQVQNDDLLNFIDIESSDDYYSWDKGDCGTVGLIVVLLKQELIKLYNTPYGDQEHQELYEFLIGKK